MEPKELRELARTGKNFTTSGLAKGHVQTNVVIIPKSHAFEFTLFCIRNPKPCPIVEVMDPGEYVSSIAEGSDIRTDVPEYKIFRNGEFSELSTEITSVWRSDFVVFLLGCSFTFENELVKNGIELPYFANKKNVPMFITSLDTEKAGNFSGKLVVTQRWVKKDKVVKAVQATSRFPNQHGPPIHIGDSKEIGIKDPYKPDFGDPWIPENQKDYTPLYWACGVTPQLVLQSAKIDISITHSPGKMFVTDLTDEDMAVI
jgi:uncharacterized protein YcsI (UPF0317 family)